MYKDNKQYFENKINFLKQKYNFRGPLHFTDYSNLGDILREGYLYSRFGCECKGLEFRDVADKSVLNHSKENVKKCVRFYYKEKTPTLYRNEGIKKCGENEPHIPIPVYLLFSNELILLKTTVFSDGNAGSDYTKYGDSFTFFNQMNWDYIMNRGSLPVDHIRKLETRRCRNAELMSLIPVSLKYLDKIIFRSHADKIRAINEFGYNEKYDVNKDMFNNENNYLNDYLIYLDEDSIQLKLKFEKYMTHNEFINDCELVILDKKGKRVGGKYHPRENDTYLSLRINNAESNCAYNNWSYIYIYLHGIKVLEVDVEQAIATKNMVDSGTLEIVKGNINELVHKYKVKDEKARGYEEKFIITNQYDNSEDICRYEVEFTGIGLMYEYGHEIDDIDTFKKSRNKFEFALNNVIIRSEEVK